MVARGEDDGHLAAAGVFQGAFCGLRSGRASAKMAFEFPIRDEVSLAYTPTVHKSQGSDYPAVVMPLATQHYPMLERNLLYTGVTRGKGLVVLIGQEKALRIAIRTMRSRKRLTNLSARLRQAEQAPGKLEALLS
jgi:exodeoxyribonuclease V alpha subunit